MQDAERTIESLRAENERLREQENNVVTQLAEWQVIAENLHAKNERGRTEIRELHGLLNEIRQAVNNVDSNANAEIRELADELIDKIDAIIGRDRQ
jgi:chromosome segregation ATPase